MAALIGALRVSLSADTAAFQQGMKRAEAQARTSSSSIQRSMGLVKASFAGFASGLSLGLITQGIKASLDYAGSLGEVAQQLGVTTRELQTFRYAVSQNGGTVENADQALGKFAISISKAQSGSKQAAAAFGAVGVSLADLASKSKTEVLGQIADRMKQTGGASANAAAGVAIFGKGFQKIVPVLDQGSAGFSELAAAADELGIILSDEQIQKADQTADKLDALMTVLKTKVAGDVADNADSILQFADALFDLVKAAEEARAALVRFQQNYNLPNLLFKGDAFGVGVAGRSATADLNEGGRALAIAKARGLKIAGQGRGTGGNVPKFLGGGGGGRKRSARAPRDTSLRDAFQFEEEQRRAEMDILRAKQDLAHDYVERTALAIEMLDLEKQSFEAEMKFKVASGDLKGPQAEALKLKFEEADRLKRLAVLEEEQVQRQRDYNMLDDRDANAKMELLEKQAGLVETARERRDIEMKILDLAYEEERRRLERIVQESKDWAEIEAARRALLDLSKRQSLDRQGVMQNTRGPLANYYNSLPTTTAKWNEELEQVAVNGLQSIEDGLISIVDGTKSVGDAFKDMAKGILSDLLRLSIRKFITAPLAGALGLGGFSEGGFAAGFATGGFTGTGSRSKIAGVVHGNEFVLNAGATSRLGVPNLNALNRGAPLSAVAGNDNRDAGGAPRGDIHIHGVRDFDSFRRNETQLRRQARRKLGV